MSIIINPYKGVGVPSGYRMVRIGSPSSYQTPRIGNASASQFILIPAGA